MGGTLMRLSGARYVITHNNGDFLVEHRLFFSMDKKAAQILRCAA